ncbi:MAG: protein-disulfide reductase DsbD domain-containing protein [Rhodanobacter sp.]
MKLRMRVCWLIVLLAIGGVAQAQGVAGLLPIDQAYQLTANVSTPGVITLHWAIAPQYYLYRGQMRFTSGDGVTLGKAQLPDGLRHSDPYLGQVEIYHDSIDASIPYALAPGTKRIRFSVRYQGCHEVEPKICYPPHSKDFDLPIPGGAAVGLGSKTNGSSSAADSALGVAASSMPMSTQVAGNPGSVSGQGDVGWMVALLLAFAGGLILNLMPCVLPVLAIKAVGLLEGGEDAARGRRHALAYTAGVLCSFAVIGIAIVALRSAGHALGWGAQLQQPLVVGVLICVMVAVGLSMSGVVQFGAALGNIGHGIASRSGWTGDFLTGVLAVVVSSPCIAPFMGTALAYAFVAPTLVALLVFLALGVGLALPLLLVGFVPALGRLLPRPGAWMETLKQVLAFPMYLTAVWLVWVLAKQRGADAVGLVLIAVVLLAMALWWFERSRYRGILARALGVVLALLAVAPLYLVAQLRPATAAIAAADTIGAMRFSPEKLAKLRQSGTPVFVDMTADWCINCKVNEHVVLDTSAFRDVLTRTGAVYMVGDWTDVNPTIGAFLKEYHSPGVPLYVVFPRDGGAGNVLPTVLTMSLVRNALEAASSQATVSSSSSTTAVPNPMDALKGFIAAIDADPDNLQAHEALSKFQMEERSPKDFKEIASIVDKQYAEWARRYPESPAVLFSNGKRLSEMEDPRARQYLLEFLATDSKAHAQLDSRAYSLAYAKLADDAILRGDDRAEVKYRRMASSLDPRDEDHALSYAFAVGSEAALLDVARRFPATSAGAEALMMAAQNAPNDTRRIELYERVRREFSSPKFQISGPAAWGLYRTYMRIDPTKAVELARQQMQATLGDVTQSSWDWPKLEKQAKAYAETLHLLDAGNAGRALGLLDALPRVDETSLGAKVARLKARVLVGANKTTEAYQLLLHQQARWPDEATGAALRSTGGQLHKTPQQITADLDALRYAHAKAAPLFDLEEYGSDRHVSLKDLRGKVVLVSFWYPGCSPCREELPGMQAAMNHFSSNKDVVFLGINGVREQDRYVLPFVTNKKYSFIPLKSTSTVLKNYNAIGFPSNFLIDRSGRIVYSEFAIGDTHDEDRLRSMIKSLL